MPHCDHEEADKIIAVHVQNKIGSLEGTLQYYYHATPEKPLQISPGVAW